MWVSTVFGEMNRCAAISALDWPSPTSRKISISRLVTPSLRSSPGTWALPRPQRGTRWPACRRMPGEGGGEGKKAVFIEMIDALGEPAGRLAPAIAERGWGDEPVHDV